MSVSTRRYPERPVPAVGVVVWKGGELLLVKRGQPPLEGQWGLPGGVVEPGETPFQAAKRELREETGIEIEPLAVITILDSVTRDAAGKVEYHYSITEMNARYAGGALRAASDSLDARWIAPAELEKMDLWEEVTHVVQRALEQKNTVSVD